MNPLTILRSWFQDPGYRRDVFWSTITSFALVGLVFAIGAIYFH